jgi:DnaJ-class molecular chaperone
MTTDWVPEHFASQIAFIDSQAYEVLSDDELRGKYDRGEDVFQNQGGGPGAGAHGFHGFPFGHGSRHFTFHFG